MTALWVWIGLALAQSTPAAGGPAGRAGIVVRLEAAGQSLSTPVSITIASSGASPVVIKLNDEGQSPDVSGGDGTFSGAGIVSGETGEVTLSAGDLTVSGGTMTLGAGSARDLSLRFDGSALSQGDAAAPRPIGGEPPQADGSPDPAATPPDGAPVEGAPPAGAPVDGATPADGAVPPVGPPVTGAPTPPLATPAGPVDTRSDAVLYVAFGVGGLLLAAVAYFWMRGGSAGGSLPRGVTVVPEPGLFGPTSPPLVPGITQWIAAADEHPWALGSLLATLGQHRPVLVCAPAEASLPGVPGGPILRVAPKKPGALLDAVDALLDAHPRLVVVLLGEPGGPGSLPKWTKHLVEDVPVILLAAAPVDGGGVVVRCKVEGGRLRGDVS